MYKRNILFSFLMTLVLFSNLFSGDTTWTYYRCDEVNHRHNIAGSWSGYSCFYFTERNEIFAGGISFIASMNRPGYFEHFDGNRFLDQISTGNKWILQILEDKDGIIYAYKDDGTLNSFTNGRLEYASIKDEDQNIICEDIMASILDNEKNLWIIRRGQLLKTDSLKVIQTFKCKLPKEKIIGTHFDEFKRLWIFFEEDGIVRFDGEKWNKYDGDNTSFPTDEFKKVMRDKNGKFWIVTDGKGVFTFDSTVINVYDKRNGSLPSNDVESIIQDKNGNIWVLTERDGIAMFDGATWRQFNEKNTPALITNFISHMVCDSAGRVWVGMGKSSLFSRVSGLAVFDRQEWKSLRPDNSSIPSDIIQYLAVDRQGSLWIHLGTRDLRDTRVPCWLKLTIKE